MLPCSYQIHEHVGRHLFVLLVLQEGRETRRQRKTDGGHALVMPPCLVVYDSAVTFNPALWKLIGYG